MTSLSRETNLVLIEDTRAKLDQHIDQIEKIKHDVIEYDVCSKWAAEELLTEAVKAKKLHKKFETLRKEILEPARKYQAKVNDIFKMFTEKLEEIEAIVKAKIESWEKKQEAERKKQEEEAVLLAAAMNLDIVPYVEKSDGKISSSDATSYKKKDWKFKVTDMKQVPLEFLMVDEEKVEIALRNGIREIPGLEVFTVEKTIIRARY